MILAGLTSSVIIQLVTNIVRLPGSGRNGFPRGVSDESRRDYAVV
jgi:hypothetical protein